MSNTTCLFLIITASDRVKTKTETEIKGETPFTRSSKHRANIKQMYSKYTC